MKQRVIEYVYWVIVFISFVLLAFFFTALRTSALEAGWDITSLPWEATLLFFVPTIFPLVWIPYIYRTTRFRAVMVGFAIFIANILVAALGLFTARKGVLQLDREIYVGVSIEILGAMTTATSIIVVEYVLSKFAAFSPRTSEEKEKTDTLDNTVQ